MVLMDRKRVAALFVNSVTQQWIVCDPEGNYWTLPSGDAPWQRREPFVLDENIRLEPIPGHYKYLLDLPF